MCLPTQDPSGRGETHSLAGEGLGGTNIDDRKETLVIYIRYVIPLRIIIIGDCMFGHILLVLNRAAVFVCMIVSEKDGGSFTVINSGISFVMRLQLKFCKILQYFRELTGADYGRPPLFATSSSGSGGGGPYGDNATAGGVSPGGRGAFLQPGQGLVTVPNFNSDF